MSDEEFDDASGGGCTGSTSSSSDSGEEKKKKRAHRGRTRKKKLVHSADTSKGSTSKHGKAPHAEILASQAETAAIHIAAIDCVQP